MSNSLHIICAKCGSMDLKFKWDIDSVVIDPVEPGENESGCSMSCDDCGTRTSFEELVDWSE